MGGQTGTSMGQQGQGASGSGGGGLFSQLGGLSQGLGQGPLGTPQMAAPNPPSLMGQSPTNSVTGPGSSAGMTTSTPQSSSPTQGGAFSRLGQLAQQMPNQGGGIGQNPLSGLFNQSQRSPQQPGK